MKRDKVIRRDTWGTFEANEGRYYMYVCEIKRKIFIVNHCFFIDIIIIIYLNSMNLQ